MTSVAQASSTRARAWRSTILPVSWLWTSMVLSSRWWGWFHNTILEEDHVGLSCYGSYAYVRAYGRRTPTPCWAWARRTSACLRCSPHSRSVSTPWCFPRAAGRPGLLGLARVVLYQQGSCKRPPASSLCPYLVQQSGGFWWLPRSHAAPRGQNSSQNGL